jgi:hypothetical protein
MVRCWPPQAGRRAVSSTPWCDPQAFPPPRGSLGGTPPPPGPPMPTRLRWAGRAPPPRRGARRGRPPGATVAARQPLAALIRRRPHPHQWQARARPSTRRCHGAARAGLVRKRIGCQLAAGPPQASVEALGRRDGLQGTLRAGAVARSRRPLTAPSAGLGLYAAHANRCEWWVSGGGLKARRSGGVKAGCMQYRVASRGGGGGNARVRHRHRPLPACGSHA